MCILTSCLSYIHPTAALTYKCMGDQWTVYCRVIREKNLCQDMRWYQRCCETCRDFYAKKILHKS